MKLLVALTLLLPLLTPPVPASASATVATGGAHIIEKRGMSFFSKYPCPYLERCQGLIKGPWQGNIDAVVGTEEISVKWKTDPETEHKWHMTFWSFDDVCGAAPMAGAATGYGEGTTKATADIDDIVFGKITNASGTTSPVTAVELTFGFDWTRRFSSADFNTKIVDGRSQIGLTVWSGDRPILVLDTFQKGVVDFFPHTDTNTPGWTPDSVPTCNDPWENIHFMSNVTMSLEHQGVTPEPW